MNTMKIYKTTETGSELIGEYTTQEYKAFMKHAEIFMRNMSELYTHLVCIRGVWSVSLWDEKQRKTVLTYQAEF